MQTHYSVCKLLYNEHYVNFDITKKTISVRYIKSDHSTLLFALIYTANVNKTHGNLKRIKRANGFRCLQKKRDNERDNPQFYR